MYAHAMSEISFEWDPAKAAGNARKHGVAFVEARSVFEDEEALVIGDPDHSHGEERFIMLGASAQRRLLVVVFCERSAGTVIRIISARRAHRWERRTYVERGAR